MTYDQPAIAIDNRVKIRRDVFYTLYCAGQRGVVLALHGNRPKVAELEVNESDHSDLVNLTDLDILRQAALCIGSSVPAEAHKL